MQFQSYFPKTRILKSILIQPPSQAYLHGFSIACCLCGKMTKSQSKRLSEESLKLHCLFGGHDYTVKTETGVKKYLLYKQ